MYSDASDFGVDGMLVQEDESQQKRLLRFFFEATEETLIVSWGSWKRDLGSHHDTWIFRVYILVYEIEARVDQISVIHLLKQNHPSKHVRYRERLSQFNPHVVYVKGDKNKTDWSWRYVHGASSEEKKHDPVVNNLQHSTQALETTQQLSENFEVIHAVKLNQEVEEIDICKAGNADEE